MFDETEDAGVRRGDSPSPSAYPADPPALLGKGDELGRYVVLRKLGAGAMGTVYLGYDPELDRKVALKMLRGATSEANRGALQREAQAMAKLAHPGVVAVHDVGEHEGRVYVAMEFVEGETLGQWLTAERRPWRDVLEVFLRAGEGLEAAHARGLIHRDFKPDNVMITLEGKVQVMDFGLARPSNAASEDEARSEELRSISGSVLTEATVGHLAGTPAYMAPEQTRAESLSSASDQFAFCVSIWEGVCGERPFAGSSLAELFFNICEREIRTPPAGVRMPRWLERVLLRGLAPEVEDRWPSMSALLAALERGRGRWRWQVALGVLTVLALVAGLALAKQRQEARERRSQLATCVAQGAVIDGVWNDEAREELRAGLLAVGSSYARHSAETSITWLDNYRDAWSSGRNELCLHDSVARDWDPELLDRAIWCFEDRRLQFEATINQIATLDQKGARRAVRLASYLDPVASCLEPNALRRLPAPPASMRREVRALRSVLTEIDRLRYGGRYDEALELAQEALEDAETLGWPPLLANARFLEGRCLYLTGRFAQADLSLTRAYFEAMKAGSLELAFRAARSLISALTTSQRSREAEIWAHHANVLAAELADPSGLDAAEGHYLLINVYLNLGDYEAADREGEQAVAIRGEALGTDHPITASAMGKLGKVYLRQGRPHAALELFERACVIWEDAVGQAHPYVGRLVAKRGRALFELGRLDEARAMDEEGIAIYEQVLRADHPTLADSLFELGKVYAALGRLDEAEQVQQRGRRIRSEKLGAQHPHNAMDLLAMSVVDRLRGRHDVALERCAAALEQLERWREPGHPDLALALQCSAEVYMDLGQPELAEREQRAALARTQAVYGAQDRRLITPLSRLADTQRARAQFDAARESYTRALAIGEGSVGDSEVLLPSLTGLAELALAEDDAGSALRFAELAVGLVERQSVGPRGAAEAHFVLARALRLEGGPEKRVASLAREAAEAFEIRHESLRRDEVERWLAGVEAKAQAEPGMGTLGEQESGAAEVD